MNAPQRRVPGLVAVVTTKANGTDVVFSTYKSRQEAERVLVQLAAVGCPARIERAFATDVPGCSRLA